MRTDPLSDPPTPPPDRVVLVALTSADHRTRRAAEEIGAELARHGLHPCLARAADVDSLAGVRAVVLGGAGDRPWARLAAVRFLRRHAVVLHVRPWWVFDVAPLPGGLPHPVDAPGLAPAGPVGLGGPAGWAGWAGGIAASLRPATPAAHV
ncbi:hypothetical protein [Pseudonocardia spirodelae]|uniref:Flavodoxin domain-containing protein n=1 Tax=Pseudonocardia spirodelae TaxID=3133431 RepID=A0ABU8TDY8_9PSEU